ncbi:MAG: NYN domain-containing protein, partial [Proteobacteria bacterium]|nr:NYN domain-containing protein [Pseudomonadota bacterium]
MLRWRIRSALYIDFENVPLSPEAIANWLAWLEDGQFEASARRRRFLKKRVYWNSHAERNRDLFRQHGFEPILVGKFSGLKNGADIRMAMDVVEATYTQPEIDEYILLTGDSDFVPVLDRLREKAKRSAVVVTEHRPNIHTTYLLHADILIPSRRLTEATEYKRAKRGLWARLSRRSSPPKPGTAPVVQSSRRPAGGLPRQPRAPAAQTIAAVRPPPPGSEEPFDGIAAALQRVIELGARQPRNYIAQKRLMRELDKIPEFRRQGATAFLGHATYKALMQELARRDPRLQVISQSGGGIGVVFIPVSPTPTDASSTIEAPDASPRLMPTREPPEAEAASF